MNRGMRRFVVAVLVSLLTVPVAALTAPPASAATRVVEDGEGEVETRHSVDRGRFTVRQSRVVVTMTYGRLVRRTSVGDLYVDLNPSSPEESLVAVWSRGNGWRLYSRLDGDRIRGAWSHRFDWTRKKVRIMVPARLFGPARDFARMSFYVQQYNRAGDRYDSLGAEDIGRG